MDILRRIIPLLQVPPPTPSISVNPRKPAIVAALARVLKNTFSAARSRKPRSQPMPYSSPSDLAKKGMYEERGKIEAQEHGIFAGITYSLKRISLKSFIFLLVVAFIAFFIYLWVNPDLRQALSDRFDVFLGSPALQRIGDYSLMPLNWAHDFFFGEVAGIADFGTRPEYQAEEIRGVDIARFAPTKLKIFEGEPFTFRADVSMDGLEQQDADITFSCLLYENDKDHEPIEGVLSISGYPSDITTLTVPKGQKKRAQIYCYFDPINEIYGQTSSGYKVYLIWEYKNFITKTRLRVYTQQQFIQDSLISQGQDPLKNLRGGSDVDSDGYAKAQCVQGCGLIDLGMSVFSELPLTETGEHHFSFRLQDTPIRKGDLMKVHSITIQLPPQELEFKDEACLITDENQLADINHLLEQEKKPFIIHERDCSFTVTQAGSQQTPQALSLVGSVNYDYGGKKLEVVRIWDKEQEAPEA